MGPSICSYLFAAVMFVVGGCLVLVIALIARPDSFLAVKNAPIWQLAGGVLGAALGQLLGGLVIDRLGWFGLQSVGLSWARILGDVFLLAKVILMARR